MAANSLHLVIVDSLNPILLQQELEAGRLPALAFLIRAGQLHPACVSTFPTVTPTALASLATGLGPEGHGIGGVMWYSRQEDRYVHYWPSHQSLVQGTLRRTLRDILVNMNTQHLRGQVATVFDRLEAADVRCGSVNFPLSRGPVVHRSRLPRLLRWSAWLPRRLAIRGPSHFWYGDALRPRGCPPAGIFRKYGLTDTRAGDYAARMIAECRPRFLLTYLNENDLHSHQHGPLNVAFSLHTVDAQLAKMLSAYGSWDAAVREARWLVVGDHSQSEVGGFPGHDLNVYKAFPGLRVAQLARGGLVRDGYDLAIAPNDRSALIYLRDRQDLDRVRDVVAAWPSVDHVFWREGNACHALRPATGTQLAWEAGGPLQDARGGRWTLSGDPGVLDLTLEGNRLAEGDYPDALHRIAGALSSGPDLVVNARLGYEFTTGFSMGHGNHGSLHRLDSLVPLVSVGVPLPPLPRTTDLLPAVLAALEVCEPTAGRPGVLPPL